MFTRHPTPPHPPYIQPPHVPRGYHSYLEYLHPSSPWRDLAQAAWTTRTDTDLGLRHDYRRNIAATTLTFPDRYTTPAVAEPNNPVGGGAAGALHHAERRAYNRAITEAPGHGEPESARFFTERHPCDYTRTNPGVGCLPWMQTTFPGRFFDYVSLTPQYAREEADVRPFLQRDFQATWDRLHPPPPPVPMPPTPPYGPVVSPLALMPPPPAHGHAAPAPVPPVHAAAAFHQIEGNPDYFPHGDYRPSAEELENWWRDTSIPKGEPWITYYQEHTSVLPPLAKGGHINLGDAVELLGPYLKYKTGSVSKHRRRV